MNTQLDGIHSTVVPADIRIGDNILARIRIRNSNSPQFNEIRIWRMSPLGVELIPLTPSPEYAKSDSVDLEITLNGNRSHFEGLVVEHIEKLNENSLLYIRLYNKSVRSIDGRDRRGTDRWLCSEQFLPSCICANPGRFNDFIYFQMRNISESGIQLACSLRNKFLITGMKLNIQVSLPLIANVAFSVVVKRINIQSESGKDYLILGAEYHELSQYTKNALGQYLIQFGDFATLDQLRKAQFIPKSISTAVDFYFLKEKEDYKQVLDLRLKANQDIGNISTGISVEDMADSYDSRARIVVGKFKGKVIATARILYNQIDDQLEQEQYVKWPSHLPRKDQILEMSRAATHSSFRKNDLLANLFGFIAATCVQSGREWVIISSTDALIPFYNKLGWRETGLDYKHPTFGNSRQSILIANVFDGMCGRKVHPLYWNSVWKNAAQHLIDSKVFVPKGTDKLRMQIYRSLSPLETFLRALRKVINRLHTKQ
ncbi:MAG: hypothetical protein KUG75_12810 [Pseudomonadales bacterium]|nr:hypothetical protein [Pseudomonadales bacterium]